jgi:hypothetical protein
MSDFSIYKQLEIARLVSSNQLTNPAQPVSQSHQREVNTPIANLAAAVTETPIGVSQYAANLAVAALVGNLPWVANATDYNTITLSKRTGNGAAVVMAVANLQSVAGTAYIPIAFTVANAANAVTAKGDIVTITNAKTGNGVANVPASILEFVLEDIG